MKNKFLSLILVAALSVIFSAKAHAEFAIYDNTTYKGEAVNLAVKGGPAVTFSYDTATVDFSTMTGARTNSGAITNASTTNLQAATTATTINFAADAGSTDTYVITLAPVPAAYVTGMMITFTANTANTGAASINVNGLGAKALKKAVSTDPGDNFIKAGSVVVAVYDGTNFQMLQPAAQ